MLFDDLLEKLKDFGECEFGIHEILQRDWSLYTPEQKRSCGRQFYKTVKSGLLNQEGWIIRAINHTNPQRYKKYKDDTSSIVDTPQLTEERYLDKSLNVGDKKLSDIIETLDWAGLCLQIVKKPLPNENKRNLKEAIV